MTYYSILIWYKHRHINKGYNSNIYVYYGIYMYKWYMYTHNTTHLPVEFLKPMHLSDSSQTAGKSLLTQGCLSLLLNLQCTPYIYSTLYYRV